MKFGTLLKAGRNLFLVLAGSLVLSPARAVTTTNVTYGFYFFNPNVVRINVGDTVSWSMGTGSHTVLGTGTDTICGGALLPCSHTFMTAGIYPYQCTVAGHAALGMTGTVIVASSAPVAAALTNAMRLANGQFRFTIIGAAKQTNIIQASTNLASPSSWVSLSTNVQASNTFTFTDTNAAGMRLRFYRVADPH